MPQDSILTLNTVRECLSVLEHTGCFFLLWARQLSRDVLGDAGFLCHKAAVLKDIIKDTHCSRNIKGKTIILRITLSPVFPVASCLVTAVQVQTSYLIHICLQKRHKRSYRIAYERYIATKTTPAQRIPCYSRCHSPHSYSVRCVFFFPSMFWKLIRNQNGIKLFSFIYHNSLCKSHSLRCGCYWTWRLSHVTVESRNDIITATNMTEAL